MITERAHPRFAHQAAVTLHVGGGELRGRTMNVSRGGLCADLAGAVVVGTEVDIDLMLIFDEETQSEALTLPGRVVWCTTVDDAFQIGVSFKPLDRELSEYLTMFLRYLDDGTKTERAKRVSSVDKRFG